MLDLGRCRDLARLSRLGSAYECIIDEGVGTAPMKLDSATICSEIRFNTGSRFKAMWQCKARET